MQVNDFHHDTSKDSGDFFGRPSRFASPTLDTLARLPLGRIHVDCVGFDDALERIIARCRQGQGGYVVTPNIDHICLAERDDLLYRAYQNAFLSLPDGMPLVWYAKLVGAPLREKVSGSDLTPALLARAAEEELRCYVLGARPHVVEAARRKLTRHIPGLRFVGFCSPRIDADGEADEATIAEIGDCHPDLILVALGCPKQELFMCRYQQALAPSVMLGVGATIDFIAGEAKRAPRWMSRMGLEWLHRLLHDPARLSHRYLVRDRAIFSILYRSYWALRNST